MTDDGRGPGRRLDYERRSAPTWATPGEVLQMLAGLLVLGMAGWGFLSLGVFVYLVVRFIWFS